MPWRGSRERVGVNEGRRSLAVRVGGTERSPAPASLLPASRANLSSRRFHAGPREAQCPQERRKGAGSARPRVLQTPHFGGGAVSCSRSYLPPLDTLSSRPSSSGAELAVSPRKRVSTELLAVSWQRVRCEAGPAHRAGEPARPTCKRAIRIDAAQPLAIPAPYQRRRGGIPGWRVAGPAGIFHFLNDSVAGQGNHWSSRLSPGSARWVILILDVYL